MAIQYSIEFECLGCGSLRTLSGQAKSERDAQNQAFDYQQKTVCQACEIGPSFTGKIIEKRLIETIKSLPDDMAQRIAPSEYEYVDLVKDMCWTIHHASFWKEVADEYYLAFNPNDFVELTGVTLDPISNSQEKGPRKVWDVIPKEDGLTYYFMR